jgi:hypothetical protein
MTTIETLPTQGLLLHPLSETHPVMTPSQYASLLDDIRRNGQISAILLYRNKVVDGRHRLKALQELKIPTIKAIRLPNNLTLQEVETMVLSTEKRRHLTPTQLAIKAYRMFEQGAKQSDAITATGCSATNLKYVSSIVKMSRLDIIEALEQGIKIDVSDDSRIKKLTDSLQAIQIKCKRDRDSLMRFKEEPNVSEKLHDYTPSQQALINLVKLQIQEIPVNALDILLGEIYKRKRTEAEILAAIDEANEAINSTI